MANQTDCGSLLRQMDTTQFGSSLVMILSAPSGTGKTTLSRLLTQRVSGLHMGISYTTRPRRDNERQGVDYHFVSETEFEQKIRNDDFLEYRQIHGYLYGTSLSWTHQAMAEGKDIVLILDIQGAMYLKRRWRHSVLVFLLPPSSRELQVRLAQRGCDTQNEIAQRLRYAREEIPVGLHNFEYVVTNTDIEQALGDLTAIVQAYRLKCQDRDALQRAYLCEHVHQGVLRQ